MKNTILSSVVGGMTIFSSYCLIAKPSDGNNPRQNCPSNFPLNPWHSLYLPSTFEFAVMTGLPGNDLADRMTAAY